MRYVLVALLMSFVGASCGTANCPSPSDGPRLEDGSYLGAESPTSNHDFWSFESSTNHELVINRADGTATLTYTDDEGREVRAEYELREPTP